ncbi:hypothetical protein EXIGLDRAFT_350556 [Exidia glandulosa HHB12029]|uniref:Zn(2)-C6 fungal-type domain-containing protein n=1 Tax=Exidia glandulosa HHB12029 TaxID=1314781 RepID=A0A165CDF3_EXIGL|nr:hypothetical protein EXIGLDRAFT_350556 [Exidia glandulosa HHB12029]
MTVLCVTDIPWRITTGRRRRHHRESMRPANSGAPSSDVRATASIYRGGFARFGGILWRSGRKLKCDGGKPTCGNCERRRQPCTYDPVIKRRGPGKKTRARAGQEGQAGEAPTPEPEPEEQMAGPSGSANVVPGAHMMAFQGYPHPLPPPSALYGHHPAHQLAPGGMHAMGGMMPAGFPIGQPIVPPGVPAHVAVPAGGHGGQRYPSPLLPGDFGGPGAPRGYKRAATRSPEGKPVAKRPETEDEADWTDEEENPYDG